jgi:hypothetical protein
MVQSGYLNGYRQVSHRGVGYLHAEPETPDQPDGTAVVDADNVVQGVGVGGLRRVRRICLSKGLF